jgi:PleD family two-component response regulator
LDDLSVEGFDVSLTGFDYKSSYDFDEEDFNFKEGEDSITKYQDKRSSGGTEISEDLKIKNIIFKIKIKCDDEKHQEELYELLKSEGYDCQILTL